MRKTKTKILRRKRKLLVKEIHLNQEMDFQSKTAVTPFRKHFEMEVLNQVTSKPWYLMGNVYFMVRKTVMIKPASALSMSKNQFRANNFVSKLLPNQLPLKPTLKKNTNPNSNVGIHFLTIHLRTINDFLKFPLLILLRMEMT